MDVLHLLLHQLPVLVLGLLAEGVRLIGLDGDHGDLDGLLDVPSLKGADDVGEKI